AFVDLTDAAQDLLAALLHIVVGADADGGDLGLGADDMLESGDKFLRELAMGDQNHADHRRFAGHALPAPRPAVPAALIGRAITKSRNVRRAEATCRSHRRLLGIRPAGAWGYR